MVDAPWALVQYVTPGHPEGRPRVGILSGSDLKRAPSSLEGLNSMDVLASWDAHAATLRQLDASSLESISGAVLVAPLTFPRKVICAGVNYFSHALEMRTSPLGKEVEPFFFLKPPSTAVVAANADVVMPIGEAKLDWEVELAVVIGRGGRDIDEEDALQHVAAYTIANDLSARGLFPRSDAVAPPFGFDWVQHKGFDGSCPLGPGLVPSWLVADPQDLMLTLRVNDVLQQHTSTSDMFSSVARLISTASRTMTLEPGDVILTGTPAGVGLPRQTFLAVDDVVTAEIDGLVGRLQNRIVAR